MQFDKNYITWPKVFGNVNNMLVSKVLIYFSELIFSSTGVKVLTLKYTINPENIAEHFTVLSVPIQSEFCLITKNYPWPIFLNIPMKFCPVIMESFFTISGTNGNFLCNSSMFVTWFKQPPAYSARGNSNKLSIVNFNCNVG